MANLSDLQTLLDRHAEQLALQHASSHPSRQAAFMQRKYDTMLKPQRIRQGISEESDLFVRQEQQQSIVRNKYLKDVSRNNRETSHYRSHVLAHQPDPFAKNRDMIDQLGLKLNPAVPLRPMKPGDIYAEPGLGDPNAPKPASVPFYQRVLNQYLAPQRKRQESKDYGYGIPTAEQEALQDPTVSPVEITPGRLAQLTGKKAAEEGGVLLNAVLPALRLVGTQTAMPLSKGVERKP
jgi:hypothetical protein